jgi:hypothetical protein
MTRFVQDHQGSKGMLPLDPPRRITAVIPQREQEQYRSRILMSKSRQKYEYQQIT